MHLVLLKHVASAEALEEALNQGTNVDINAKDIHGDTLGHFAARIHSLDSLCVLYKYGADMEAVNEHGRRPLHEAIDSRDCVEFLVTTCKVDVNAFKRGDWTPIMIAALKGRLDVVELLARHGGRLDLASKDGRTALHMTAQEGHAKLLIYFAQHSPEAIMKSTRSGRIPLQMAAAFDKDHQTSYSMTMALLDSFPEHRQDMLAHRDRSGRTALLDAVISGNNRLVEALLSAGADPHQVDAIGRGMIHYAAMTGHVEILRMLHRRSTDIPNTLNWDAPDTWDHWSPLMHAAKEGQQTVAEFLIHDIHVDTKARSKQGRTAKDIGKSYMAKHKNLISCEQLYSGVIKILPRFLSILSDQSIIAFDATTN